MKTLLIVLFTWRFVTYHRCIWLLVSKLNLRCLDVWVFLRCWKSGMYRARWGGKKDEIRIRWQKRERESRHGKRGRVLAAYNFDDKQKGGYLSLLLTLLPRTASGEPPPRDCINSSHPSTPASHLHLTLPSVLPLPRISSSSSRPTVDVIPPEAQLPGTNEACRRRV